MARTTIRLVLVLAACLGDIVFGLEVSPTSLWTAIAADPKGDGRDPSLADAAQLSYRFDAQEDMLWFRVALFGRPDADAFGVNIAVDTGADDSDRTNWWGANKEFRFDRLVTAWVTRVDGVYKGAIGISDAAGAREKRLTNLKRNNLELRVERDSILIGLKRSDLTDRMKMNVVAAVGSPQTWSDDIPNVRSAAIDLSAPRQTRGLREIDTTRNNLTLGQDKKTLAPGAPPQIVRRGRGPHTLILIPGVYSGASAFDDFIARNDSKYTCYVVTPPGLNGTPARSMPPQSTSYGELTWTRELLRDILALIERERLIEPIVVAHGFPGSLAAEELALSHGRRIGGIVEIASMPAQFFPSWRNSGRDATPDERAAVVDQSWAQHWFKYVTPETWESNNYPAAMLANDPARAERARQQLEAAPLPVKIRYLTEYMASDHRPDFARLSGPVLVLTPGFNDVLLKDPAYGWLKSSLQDSWDTFPKAPGVQLAVIPDARALMLDDQPTLTDGVIARFVDGILQQRQ
jgi:pimeloyl-ACP methyl ester carboxylesterase